jgi:hypothetical protein
MQRLEVYEPAIFVQWILFFSQSTKTSVRSTRSNGS